MKMGIIGLPKSGKTTIFELLTKNFPENPNRMEHRIGTIKVPDSRVDVLSKMYNPKKTIFAQVEYYLPGKMETKREQIWNQVRDCDALIHVVRNFEAYDDQNIDLLKDFKALDQELIFADLMVAEKKLEFFKTEKKRGRKFDEEEYEKLEACHKMLEDEIPIRSNIELSTARVLKGYTFLSAKPILILFNNGDDIEAIPKEEKLTSTENCVAIRGKLEHEISQMSAEDAGDFMVEFGIKTLATDAVIEKSYDLLGLISFFTVGEDEVRAWTIRKETAAVDAAEAIHSDIKKGFIRAEVLYYDDLMDAGNYVEARKKGTVRLEGKTYIVKNGDIINFRFNV